jgi:hypothetical protein
MRGGVRTSGSGVPDPLVENRIPAPVSSDGSGIHRDEPRGGTLDRSSPSRSIASVKSSEPRRGQRESVSSAAVTTLDKYYVLHEVFFMSPHENARPSGSSIILGGFMANRLT